MEAGVLLKGLISVLVPFGKKGMYIVEASIIFPLFIVSMVIITGIIPVVSVCENVVCSASDELRFEAAKAPFGGSGADYIVRVSGRILSENRRLSMFILNSYRHGISENGIDDLMHVRFSAGFRNGISLIAVNSIVFKGDLMARAFTGTYHKVGDGYDDTVVYIFPQDGRKYHSKGCRYLTAHCHMTVLSDALMTRFHACPLCRAGHAHIGETVICFERAGEAYHMPDCRQVEKEKYYTETIRSSAERAGYTPCSVCGG